MNDLDILLASESHEWYTPRIYLQAVRQLLGHIDLDPASCEQANQAVQATSYYDSAINGLDKPWRGKVFLNPPYGKQANGKSNQEIWSCRLIEQYEARITTEAVLLINAVVGNSWFERLWNYSVCLTNHRIRFDSPTGRSMQPTFSNAFIYFGEKHEQFKDIFQHQRKWGRVFEPDHTILSAVNKELWTA